MLSALLVMFDHGEEQSPDLQGLLFVFHHSILMFPENARGLDWSVSNETDPADLYSLLFSDDGDEAFAGGVSIFARVYPFIQVQHGELLKAVLNQ